MPRGAVELKGKGLVETCYLVGRRVPDSDIGRSPDIRRFCIKNHRYL